MCPEPHDIAHGSKVQDAPDGIFNAYGSVVIYTCDKSKFVDVNRRDYCDLVIYTCDKRGFVYFNIASSKLTLIARVDYDAFAEK